MNATQEILNRFVKLSREHLTSKELNEDYKNAHRLLTGVLNNLMSYLKYSDNIDYSVKLPISMNVKIQDGVVNEHAFWQGFKDLVDYPTYLSLLSYIMNLGGNVPKFPISCGLMQLIKLKNNIMENLLDQLSDMPLHQMAFFNEENQSVYTSPLETIFSGSIINVVAFEKNVKEESNFSFIETSVYGKQNKNIKDLNVFERNDNKLLMMLIQRASLEYLTHINNQDQEFALFEDWEIGLKDGTPYVHRLNPHANVSNNFDIIVEYVFKQSPILIALLQFNYYLQSRNNQIQTHDVRDISQLMLRAGFKKGERLSTFLHETIGGDEPENLMSHYLKLFKHFKKACSRPLTDFAGNTPDESASEYEKAEAAKEAEVYASQLLLTSVNDMAQLLESGETNDFSQVWLVFCYLSAKYSDFINDNFHANFHPEGLKNSEHSNYLYSLSQWENSIIQNFKSDLHTLPIVMDNHLIVPSFFLLSNPKVMLDDGMAWYLISEKTIFENDVTVDKNQYIQWFIYQSMEKNQTLKKLFQTISSYVFEERMNGYLKHYQENITLMPFLPMLQKVWMDCLKDGENAPMIIQEQWGKFIHPLFNQSEPDTPQTPPTNDFDD